MALPVRATYRVQLTPSFGFGAAAALVPYLARLGVTHLYTSPLAEAVPGSGHGYDVTDHHRVRAELGGPDGLRHLWEVLAEHGMGQVLDLVPNHMGIRSASNRWWWSVLAEGPDSPYADHFDIDWHRRGEAAAKVVLPFLGAPLPDVVAAGELTVEPGTETGQLVVRHHGDRWPASEQSLTVAGLSAGDCEERAAEALDSLRRDASLMTRFVDAQHWRPVHWRRTAELLNWRRFFDVTDLAGVRVERPEVFDDVHSLLRGWLTDDPLAADVIDGVRIDHVDGLVDPRGYLERLRALVGPERSIVVEKILAADEALPDAWPVDGTTGYEITARLNEALTLGPGAQDLRRAWARDAGGSATWPEVERSSRTAVLDDLLAPETRRAAQALVAVTAELGRPLATDRAEDLVREMATGVEVYRTYPEPGSPHLADADRARIDHAADRLRGCRTDLPAGDVELVAGLLGRRAGHGRAADEFVVRFNQLTAPLAAKATEDTGFYRYLPTVWMNEVGGDPTLAGRPAGELHAALAATAERWPQTFVPLTTHDTKRGGDVRARLGRLAERPTAFTGLVETLRRVAGTTGDPSFEWLVIQTLVGAWPLEPDRAHAYLTKAMREAKAGTSWLDPDEGYESAVHDLVDRLLGDRDAVAALDAAAARVRGPGRAAAVAQVVLAHTVAGTPDLYQGDELWNLILVDPDNRRPVDGPRYAAALDVAADLDGPELVERWRSTSDDPDDDGVVKLAVIHRLLALRHGREPVLGASLPHRRLEAHGPERDQVLAFARGDRLAVVVPRRFDRHPDATVVLSAGGWRDVLADRPVEGGAHRVAELTTDLPAAVLVHA